MPRFREPGRVPGTALLPLQPGLSAVYAGSPAVTFVPDPARGH